MKKVYFAGSIRGGRGDADVYKQIIDLIASYGHEVLTEHIGLKTLKTVGEAGKSNSWIYDRDMQWLKQCDALIADVTTPSLGVGYEIAKAEQWGKPTLILYRQIPNQSVSALIIGNPNLKVSKYNNVDELGSVIQEFTNGF